MPTLRDLKVEGKKNNFKKTSGFDLADLFANWHFGAIIKRKPREDGMGDPPETWQPGDLVKPVWLLQDSTYFIMWADIVKT